MNKGEQTQWAATYLVAAELTRRGYRVGWPMGNAPVKDLLVESPQREHFEVDVKGGSYKASVKSYWHLVQKGRVQGQGSPSLFFIFVRVDPSLNMPADFYILSHSELIELHDHVKSTTPPVSSKGVPYKEFTPGFRPVDLAGYKENWDALPR